MYQFMDPVGRLLVEILDPQCEEPIFQNLLK